MNSITHHARHTIRAGVLAALAILAAPMTANAEKVQLDVAAGEAPNALKEFIRQTGLQLIFDFDSIAEFKTHAVSGQYEAADALAQMLADTGLVFDFINERTVTVTRKDARESHRLKETANAPSAETVGLEEIIVTAQKRDERLQEVPIPVTAISAEVLADRNQLRLQDYYTRIPGLNLTLFGNENAPQISIRGITTGGYTNPTVSIVVDDVAYGATAVPGASPTVPDIDPGDLARIEVLRGPQGALYGAANIGGLLKFVTVDPSTERLSGRLQAGVTSTHASTDEGYSLRGAVNVPLGSTLAVAASGFTLRTPGYVDNLQTGERDSNRRDSQGGRVSALWQPSETLTLKLSAMLQESERDAPDETDTSLGSGFQLRSFPGTGAYLRDSQAYSATMTLKLPGAELTSLTGYNIDETSSRVDQTAVYGGLASIYFPGVTGAVQTLATDVDKLTQEVRAVIPIGERIEWLIGGFYTKEEATQRSRFVASDTTTGADAGSFFGTLSPSTFEEYAVFSNVQFDITEQLDFQVGARASRNEQSYGSRITGFLARDLLGADPVVLDDLDSNDDAFTFQVTPRFKVSPDLMLYARIASGYRPGGINTGCGFPGVPCEYDPDTTLNYELGIKGSLLERMLTFDASAYYIDWKDIQISLSTGVFGYQGNATRARSRGIELSVEAKPMRGTTLASWVAFNDAVLTEDFPATASAVGFSGDRLPHSSRYSGSLSIDQEFRLGTAATGFVGGSVSYVGERKGVFKPATVARETLGGYAQTDVHAGARLDNWTLNAFINNVTDKRGVLRTGVDIFQPTYLTYIQPRTVGISLSRVF